MRQKWLPLSKSRRFLCDCFGLSYELFTGGFSGSLGFGRRSVLSRAKTFDRSAWKVSFTRVRRFFTTFGSPFLVAPIFKGFNLGNPRLPPCTSWQQAELYALTTDLHQYPALLRTLPETQSSCEDWVLCNYQPHLLYRLQRIA
jgi:hypothetical protein